ncbi:unnamed protein product [Larinioides sclopetarius]|uniref:Kinase n=1 Tax=Larinioides sclopetarius TaxID=280406 RepID=A0AAV1ZN96_9ARAC
MAFQSMAADSGGSYEPLQLEPFIHQVGGHSSMLQLDEVTICKPLISQELNFYKSAPDNIKEFMAEYKGLIEVTFSEAHDGYLDLTTYIPPTLKKSSSKPNSRSSSLSDERKTKHRDTQKYPPLKMNCYLPRIRLCQSGNIQIESIPFDDEKKKYEECNHGKGQNGSLLNPWVLHCHQKQMKKLQKSSSTISQNLDGPVILKCCNEIGICSKEIDKEEEGILLDKCKLWKRKLCQNVSFFLSSLLFLLFWNIDLVELVWALEHKPHSI